MNLNNFTFDRKLQSSGMINPSYISTPKITVTYTHQNHPPIPQKSLRVEDSRTYQNQVKNNLVSSGNKLGKKYSYESRLGFDEQNKLGGSCKIIPRQKIVPKSHSTNLISSKVQSLKKNRKSTIKINKNSLQNEIRLYEWRASTHFPIMKVNLLEQKSQILQKRANINGQIQVEVFIHWQEDIKYRLGQIDCLNLINSLYILQQSLVGFQRLFNKFGYFQPSIDMIFITNLMKCKLWLNTDIWKNNQENNFNKSKKLHMRVQIFYQKVIKMFSYYFTFMFNNKMQQQTKRNINLIEKLLHQLSTKQDFIQALKFIHQFLVAYTLKINNRFLDIDEINQTRSKIFNKIENTNRSSLKMKTLPAIPISLQMQSYNQQKLIKKISLDNDYQDIQRVLNSTNRTRGNYQNLNQQNLDEQIDHKIPLMEIEKQKPNNHSEIILNQKQQPHIKTLKNSTNKQHLNQVTQSNCKTIIINKKTNHNHRDNKSFKRQSQVSICSKQTIVEKKNRFSMHQQNINNQDKFQHVKDILPNFTNEDFVQPQEEDINQNNQENQPLQNNQQKYQIGLSRHQKMAADQEEYQQRVRNQIEKNVRQRNGWLLNPLFLLQADDCAKSFQDSQPSVKAKIRDRNLSKLNRIKSSIANSIVE